MKNYREVAKLLGTANAKTVKGEKLGFTTYILYLSPFTNNSKGINLCAHASEGCANACLFGSGRGSFDSVIGGRSNKTEYFLEDRSKFLLQLVKELTLAEKRHAKKGDKFAVRLNGTSDVRFEKFKIVNGKNIYEMFPSIQFYDYTKNPRKIIDNVLPNYHLTFSKSETNDKSVAKVLDAGFNVAMVFDSIPTVYKGRKVVNGDESDLRFKDEQGVIVGLKYKRLTSKGADNEEAFTSGFAVRVKETS